MDLKPCVVNVYLSIPKLLIATSKALVVMLAFLFLGDEKT